MKYIKTLTVAVLATALFTFNIGAAGTNTLAKAENQWALSLSGNGTTQTENDWDTTIGVQIDIGRTGELLLPVEGGVRQGIAWSSKSDDVLFSTKAYANWTLLKYKKLELAAGGNIGAVYGDTPLTWIAAPEVVGKLWVKDSVGLFGRVEYPFNLNNSQIDDRLDYTIGVTVRF